MNSVIKEKGSKKSELRKSNLLQLLEHIKNIFQRTQTRSEDQIISLIQSKKSWSDYVQKIWMENFTQAEKLPFVREAEPNIWEVSSFEDFHEISHLVCRCDPDLNGIPTCNCATFLSCWIPCSGICAVFSRVSGDLFVVENLHMRWRLNGHPLFQKALSKLSLTSEESLLANHDEFNAGPSTNFCHQTLLDQSCYNSIVFPTKRDVRYSVYNQALKKIESRVLNNEHFFKLMMMNIVSFGNFMLGHGSGNFQTSARISSVSSTQANRPFVNMPILPPAKRGCSSKNDDKNRFLTYHHDLYYLITFGPQIFFETSAFWQVQCLPRKGY